MLNKHAENWLQKVIDRTTFSTSSSSTSNSSPEVVNRILSFPVSGSAEPHLVAGVKPPRCNNQILSEVSHACSCARCSSDRACKKKIYIYKTCNQCMQIIHNYKIFSEKRKRMEGYPSLNWNLYNFALRKKKNGFHKKNCLKLIFFLICRFKK